MVFTGIDPDGVRLLADRLAATADSADDLALDIGRALFDSGLASQTPAMMRGLAGELARTSVLLRRRADTAQGLVVDFALHRSLLNVAHAVAIGAATCALGPSTSIGFASPCDSVESIKVYSLVAGAYIPLAALAGLKLDAAYILRVEHLRSGRLRVTRIDDAAVGVAWGIGQDAELHAGPLTTMSGASAKAWMQVLMAQGATYEIAASELDEFIVSDLLDHLDDRFSLPGGLSGFGLLRNVAKKVTGFADGLPLWKAHGPVTAMRRRLNWSAPAPLSTYTEVGVTAGSNASATIPFFAKIPVKGKTGLAASARAVVGYEQRKDEKIFYLDIQAEIGTPLAVRLFGVDLSKLAAVETKIGVVRNDRTGEFDRIELTIVTENAKNLDRRTAVIDLTDPTTHDAAQSLIDGVTNPTGLPDAIDAIEKLLGHRVTIEHTTMRRLGLSTYGMGAFGNNLEFTVDELDVR